MQNIIQKAPFLRYDYQTCFVMCYLSFYQSTDQLINLKVSYWHARHRPKFKGFDILRFLNWNGTSVSVVRFQKEEIVRTDFDLWSFSIWNEDLKPETTRLRYLLGEERRRAREWSSPQIPFAHLTYYVRIRAYVLEKYACMHPPSGNYIFVWF